MPLPSEARIPNARICWIQKQYEGPNKDVWAIDDIQVLPHLTSAPDHVVQFGLNLHCGGAGENST